jgi:peptide/nickel transport system ATP-binding protein
VQALEAGPTAAVDQPFACFFPHGELDEDMLVVHEAADPSAP